MAKLIAFGETVKGYDIPVVNEREARAAAGIMFAFAIVSFMVALLDRNFLYIQILIVGFFVEFLIRSLINPRFAPFLILGRLIVSNQSVEYTGSPQKRFAWSLGLLMASFMLVWVVFLGKTGMVNLSVCLVCLVLLFMETAFGICVGCKMYNAFTTNTAKHCPGGVCEMKFKEKIQMVSWQQIVVLLVFVLLMVGVYFFFVLRNLLF